MGRPARVTPRLVLAATALVVVVAVVFLLSPKVPINYQVQLNAARIRLIGKLGFPLNFDSPQFLARAENPRLLLEPGDVRQARPVFIAAAWLLGSSLSPV